MAVLSKNFFVQPHKFYICFFSKKTKKFQNPTVTMSKLKRNASNILSKKSVGIHTLRQPGRKCHICCFQFKFVQNYDSRKLRIYSFFRQGLEKLFAGDSNYNDLFFYQMNLTVIYKAVHDGNGKITADNARAALRIPVKPDPVKYSNKY